MDGLKRCQVALWCGVVLDYTFDEEFLVRPLKDGRVLVHWQFVTRWHPEAGQIADRAKHFGLFPKTLGQIVQRFSVQSGASSSMATNKTDLLLVLSARVAGTTHNGVGHCCPRQWALSCGPGFSLLLNESMSSLVWKGLTHALSGLMCGSLNLIDTKSTCQPNAFFRPSSPATADQGTHPPPSPQL
ncbi:phosphatidylinositol glycan anchor biosynthesis, class T family protein [Acanthamoeba castellanii str. Neff]|uniref:Phosphatidylinositol glycan anchor biosynthesis, class T family protein n=1 Tax=Acanthamoeba castellanii (strain ATCC 30010 / Neff) TaxID=1257118 RepID=L8H723_ACACF|nr:phosphatidylinositol glycan anchor biosynthesis, class T family protein [Acanthamoeba castellanii str. Neff]ELR21022.1 phosphatidylinositol glycan anchor biosynthesis, class T family protein [Acanthamoeba castellanii str. Neff]